MQSASPIDSPTLLADLKRVISRIFRNENNDKQDFTIDDIIQLTVEHRGKQKKNSPTNA